MCLAPVEGPAAPVSVLRQGLGPGLGPGLAQGLAQGLVQQMFACLSVIVKLLLAAMASLPMLVVGPAN